MLHITVLAVGKLKEDYLVRGTREYLKRLSSYAKVSLVEIADQRIPERPTRQEQLRILENEEKNILRQLKEDAYIIALDIQGATYSSEEMAAKIDQVVLTGKSHLVFIIGGTLGLSENILQRAHLRLSFSNLTFPHQLFRLILLEQIYRWFKIQRGEPYHN